MSDDKNSKNWEALTTVKSFDPGIARNLEGVQQSGITQMEVVNASATAYTATTTTTPISLFVQSLVQQFCSLIGKDENQAKLLYNGICERLYYMNLMDDSYDMGEFAEMRNQYQNALQQLITATAGIEWPTHLPLEWPITRTGLEWSRYHKTFVELSFIASGGFGSVFRAKHYLDGVEYAIKKILIKSNDLNTTLTHLAEVKTFASLNHPNIVSYKSAWLEPAVRSKQKTKRKFQFEDDSFSIDTKKSSVYLNTMTSFKTYNSKELTRDISSDFEISFRNSDGVDVPDSPEETTPVDTETIPTHENAICKLARSVDFENCSTLNLQWATLFIQMTLCEQTLKEWLADRNHNIILSRSNSEDLSLTPSELSDTNISEAHNLSCPVVWKDINLLVDMFTQLVRGLDYIHSKKITHHDVKPGNIFVATNDDNILVQLGDFGLACPLQRSHCGLALGTHMYAAPEQLAGQCNPKSDLYSLGIILFEIIELFNTDMERVKTITDLRKGQIPAHLTANYPKLAHIISKLVERRPSKRYDTKQLLEELKCFSDSKDETIRQLKEELGAKEEEIAKLKLMLEKLSPNS